MPEEGFIGDITGNVSNSGPVFTGNIQDAPMGSIPQDLEHPLIWLFDQGMSQSQEFCKAQGLPKPASFIWSGFSRPLLNKALHHYIPEQMTPESPALCLSLGLGGLIAAHIPVYVAYKQKQALEAKQKAGKIESKDSIKQTIGAEQEAQESQQPEKLHYTGTEKTHKRTEYPDQRKQEIKPEGKPVKAEIKKISPEIMAKFGMNSGALL